MKLQLFWHRGGDPVLNTMGEQEFENPFKQWQRRWQRCIVAQGDYFEGGWCSNRNQVSTFLYVELCNTTSCVCVCLCVCVCVCVWLCVYLYVLYIYIKLHQRSIQLVALCNILLNVFLHPPFEKNIYSQHTLLTFTANIHCNLDGASFRPHNYIKR